MKVEMNLPSLVWSALETNIMFSNSYNQRRPSFEKDFARQKICRLQTALETPSGLKGTVVLIKIYRLWFVVLVFVKIMSDWNKLKVIESVAWPWVEHILWINLKLISVTELWQISNSGQVRSRPWFCIAPIWRHLPPAYSWNLIATHYTALRCDDVK